MLDLSANVMIEVGVGWGQCLATVAIDEKQ